MTESARGASGRIFVNYRRGDTAYAAGWLYDRLAEHFGGQVFKDVDSIEPGEDFVEKITHAVASCDVLLALIGDRWLTITDADGTRRLDNPDDFVRLEIEAGLTRDVRVIPILVAGTSMPDASDVPASLAKLVRHQALVLSPSHFNADLSPLLRALDSTLTQAHAPPAAQQPESAALALWTERDPGTRHMRPSRDRIYQLVSELSLPGKGNNFLVIERQDQPEWFAKTARAAQNDYVVEYRDGDAARHFTAAHLTMHQAQAALEGWASNLPGWQDRFIWTRTPPATVQAPVAKTNKAKPNGGKKTGGRTSPWARSVPDVPDLTFGTLILGLPLLILGVKVLVPSYAFTKPWALAVLCSAILGGAVAAVEHHRHRIPVWTATLEFFFTWFLIYALYKLNVGHIHRLVAYVPPLAILTGVGAIVSAVLCTRALARSPRNGSGVHPLLPAFLSCMVVGLGAAALGYASTHYPAVQILQRIGPSCYHIGGVFLFAALAADLLVPLLALVRKLNGR
jgi:TIR domain